MSSLKNRLSSFGQIYKGESLGQSLSSQLRVQDFLKAESVYIF